VRREAERRRRALSIRHRLLPRPNLDSDSASDIHIRNEISNRVDAISQGELRSTISARFQENSRETRMTLADLIGGVIRLMPREGTTRELDVTCALSTTTSHLAQLSSAFISTQRSKISTTKYWFCQACTLRRDYAGN
jgi:hypothetical protein